MPEKRSKAARRRAQKPAAQRQFGGPEPATAPASSTSPDPSAPTLAKFLEKFRGQPLERAPPALPLRAILATFVVSCVVVAVPALFRLVSPQAYASLFIAPFYGSAVLFGFPDAPFSQPRNVIGGHVIAGASGILAANAVLLAGLSGAHAAAAVAPVAVAVAIAGMLLTRTMHPPAAGTAILCAGLGGAAGVLSPVSPAFMLTPVLSGAIFHVGLAALANNLFEGRRYPKYWLG